MTTHKRNKF